MRVSSLGQYNNFVGNQQTILKDLLKVNNQVTTGKKIQFGHEDTSTYLDFLRFYADGKTLEQIKDTSQKAGGFSSNTDVAISSVKKTLEAFKVKLINAANASHSTTSLHAIANDLEAFRNSILDTLNSSVGGNYLFSGTNFKQKPFDRDGSYKGNAFFVNAHVGNEVSVAYNTTGSDVAHGYTYDYARKVSMNVQKYNQTLLHKKQLDKEDPDGLAQTVPINKENTIKDLVGNPDLNEPTYFYFRARRPDGTGVKTRFEVSSDAKVSDLLEKIGRELGNTELYKAVDVSLSKLGQIEIKDMKEGRLMTDFHLVASNVKTDNLDNIEESHDTHIFSFNKSGYSYVKDSSKVSAEQDYYDKRMFRFNTILRGEKTGEISTTRDKARDILGEDVDTLTLSVNNQTFSYDVTKLTTMENLFDNIKRDVSATIGKPVDVQLQKGMLTIFDRTTPKDQTSITDLSLSTSNKIMGKPINAFSAHEGVSFDKAYFEKNGAILKSNTAQVVRKDSSFATAQTQLNEVSSGANLEEQTFIVDLVDINGIKRKLKFTLRDHPTADGHLSTFEFVHPQKSQVFDIYDEKGRKTSASAFTQIEHRVTKDEVLHIKEERKGMTYRQLFGVVSMALAGEIPKDGTFEKQQESLEKASKNVYVAFDGFGKMIVKDTSRAKTLTQLSIYSEDTNRFDSYEKTMTKTLKQTYTGVKNEQGWDLVDTDATASLKVAFGFSFSTLTLQGTDYEGNAKQVQLNENMTVQDLKDTMMATFGSPRRDLFVRAEGSKLVFKDNTANDKTLANINFVFSDAKIEQEIDKTPALSFMANSSLKIVDANMDLFSTLDSAIEAVRAGSKRADADAKNPRNIGVQNSIEAIDQILDHLNRVHTKNGSTTISLDLAHKKSIMTALNVKELESMVLDADIAEVSVKLNQRLVAYQSLLGLMGKISKLNLVNYI